MKVQCINNIRVRATKKWFSVVKTTEVITGLTLGKMYEAYPILHPFGYIMFLIKDDNKNWNALSRLYLEEVENEKSFN